MKTIQVQCPHYCQKYEKLSLDKALIPKHSKFELSCQLSITLNRFINETLTVFAILPMKCMAQNNAFKCCLTINEHRPIQS